MHTSFATRFRERVSDRVQWWQSCSPLFLLNVKLLFSEWIHSSFIWLVFILIRLIRETWETDWLLYFHNAKLLLLPGRKLNVHKTFRRRPGCLLNVLCAFNLRPVYRGYILLLLVSNKDDQATKGTSAQVSCPRT